MDKKYIYIGVGLVVLLIIIKKKEGFKKYNKTYYKCDKYKMIKVVDDIFTKYGIMKTQCDNSYNCKKYDIYIPCTYNTLETDILKMKTYDGQVIFGISGCDKIVSKNNLWRLIELKYGREKARKIMPESWLLMNKSSMDLFKKSYKKGEVYIMKKNLQRKLGLKLTTDYNEIINGHKDSFIVVQKYMKDLYLLNNRKINLRVYMLIVCKDNKKTVYMYKNGKCIYTNKDYKKDSLEEEENITSVNLDLDIYKKSPFDFNELKEYIGNPSYSKLFSNIKENIKKVMIASKIEICNNKELKKNITYQLFGLDYIFDNDYNVYLLEANKGPNMNSTYEKDYKLKYNVMLDVFDKINIINTNKRNSFIEIKI